MPSITLTHGTVDYRVAGPQDAAGPPVVFVHGVLVDATLWTRVADRLAAAGVRSYAPDLPLGSHRRALSEAADRTPRGVARQLNAFLEALELTDVTLVGNDTGGAICQLLLDEDPSRIGRLVLTNCDAFEQFPPPAVAQLFMLLRSETRILAGMQPMRATALRHSSRGYGPLANALDAEQTRRWIDPLLSDAAVRHDLAAFCRGIAGADLQGASERLAQFAGPSLVLWGADDETFVPDLGRRLAAALRNVRHVEIPGARTFVSLDDAERVTREIVGAFYAAAGASSDAGIAPAGIDPSKRFTESAS